MGKFEIVFVDSEFATDRTAPTWSEPANHRAPSAVDAFRSLKVSRPPTDAIGRIIILLRAFACSLYLIGASLGS